MTELKKISDIDSADPDCPDCEGWGWVCEEHPDQFYINEGGDHCGAPGIPCECNDLSKFNKVEVL